MTLPAGWTSIQAQKKWNGRSGFGSDSPEVDQLIGPGTGAVFSNASVFAVATPWRRNLAAAVTAVLAAAARFHGTCPHRPETGVTVGGDRGVLVDSNCGLLINLAVAVHHGVDYQFTFRDPTVQAATDPADQATFSQILKSVRFRN